MDLGLSQSREFVPPISILSAEDDSLCRALEAKIETLRDEIEDLVMLLLSGFSHLCSRCREH